MALLIGLAGVEAIRAHVEAAYPEEACGLLVGRDASGNRRIERVCPVPNRHRTRRDRRYSIAPEDFLGIDRQARARGLDVVGFYHSHPDHRAEPSRADRQAAWPHYAYLIASVLEGRVAGLRAFRLTGEQAVFVEEPLAIEPARRPPAGAGRE